MAVRKRPQDIPAPRPEVVTRPVNTFARPEPPALPPDAAARTDLLQLAKSLGGMSEQLGDYARAYTRNTAEGGASEAYGLRLRNTNREVSRMLNTPGGVPANVNRTALELGHGEDLARTDFEDIRRRYLGESTAPQGQPSNAFDRNSGDLDGWFKQLVRRTRGPAP